MAVIMNKNIVIGEHTEDDLMYSNTKGNLLTIQLVGSSSINITGKNIASNTYSILGVVDVLSFDVLSTISSPGIYNCDITGIDSIKINLVSENADTTLYVKVVGD